MPPVALSANTRKSRVFTRVSIKSGPYRGGVAITPTEDYQPYGWADAMQQYHLSDHECLSDPFAKGDNPKKRGYSDYWYNSNAAAKWVGEVGNDKNLIIMGDGDGGALASTARYSINALPAQWLKSPKSPAYRHVGGANYLYLDGHVKWLRPKYLSQTGSHRGAKNTFSVDPAENVE